MPSQHLQHSSPHPEVTLLVSSLPKLSESMQPTCDRLNTKGRSSNKHCSVCWCWQAGIRDFSFVFTWRDAGTAWGGFMLPVSPAGPEAWAGGWGNASPLHSMNEWWFVKVPVQLCGLLLCSDGGCGKNSIFPSMLSLRVKYFSALHPFIAKWCHQKHPAQEVISWGNSQRQESEPVKTPDQ